MKTLKELVESQEYTGMSDIEIIRTFFITNNMEVEGLDLIYELTKSKVEKLKQEQYIVREWCTSLPSTYLYETYELEVADRLHMMELDYLTNGGKLSDSYLAWAKENVPNIIKPTAYLRPLLDWLENRGIRFKKNKGK